MALASLFGGLALANAELGAVHGFAGPIGDMFSAPHGAVCAALLIPVVEVNTRVLSERDLDHSLSDKYKNFGKLNSGRETPTFLELIEWFRHIFGHEYTPLGRFRD